MKKKEEFISVPDIAELYGCDPSYLRKMLKKNKIKTKIVRRASDNKRVSVVSDEDHQKLIDLQANLTAEKLKKAEITVGDACKKLGFGNDQMSNFTRWCRSLGIEYTERKVNGRTQKTLKKKDFDKICSLRKAIVTLEV